MDEIELQITDEQPITLEVAPEEQPIELHIEGELPSSSGGGNIFVYNSNNEVDAPNRFDDWFECYAAARALADKQPVVIAFEQIETLPANMGGYNFDNFTLRGLSLPASLQLGGDFPFIYLEDGFKITSWGHGFIQDFMNLVGQNTEYPIFELDNQMTILQIQEGSTLANGGSEAFFKLGTGSMVAVKIDPAGGIVNLSTSGFPGATGGEVFELSGMAQAVVFNFGGNSSSDLVKGDGGAFQFINAMPNGLEESQFTNSNFTGYSQFANLARASQVGVDIEALNALFENGDEPDVFTIPNVQKTLETLTEGLGQIYSGATQFFGSLGQPNGIAQLDGDGKLLSSQLPEISVLQDDYIEYDLTGKIATLSGYISGAYGKMWYRLDGNQMSGFISIVIPNSAIWPDAFEFLPIQTVIIRGADLPYMPRNWGVLQDEMTPISEPGGFGMLNATTDPETGAGKGYAIGSATSNMGGLVGEEPAMIFFKIADPTNNGIDNLLIDSEATPLLDADAIIFTRFIFEKVGEYVPPAPGISITGSFDSPILGSDFDQQLAIVLEDSELQLPLSLEIISGSFPVGMSLTIYDDDMLRLNGTPTIPGEVSFVVKITDALETEYTKSFSFTVGEFNLSHSGSTYPDGVTTMAYNRTQWATYADESQLPLEFEVVSGSLPPGLTLATVDGFKSGLSGTPTTAGTYNFRLRTTDQYGTEVEGDFTMVVHEYNPSYEPSYLGTVSGNSYNINFVNDWFTLYGGSQNIHTWTAAHAVEGQILKIRSGTMNYDFGEGMISVPINDYMRYEDGHWRYYDWN